MISEKEFMDLQETAHLLGSPRRADCLLRSIRQIDSQGAQDHDLIPAQESKA